MRNGEYGSSRRGAPAASEELMPDGVSTVEMKRLLSCSVIRLC